MKIRKKSPFTLIEITICLALLLMLTSTFSYLGYGTIKEFQKRNGRAAFRDFLTILHHENALLENNLMLLIYQNGDTVETTLGGNTKGITHNKKHNSFYVRDLFKDQATYAIKITPRSIPTDDQLTIWIEQNNCVYRFYEE